MKIKPLAITTAILAATAATLWLATRDAFKPVNENPLVGRQILPGDTASGATRIEIATGGQTAVIIQRADGGLWTLPGYFSLPADFQKLTRLVSDLMETSIERAVTKDPERLERLSLGQESVRLYEGDTQTWAMESGDPGPNGGRFIKLASDETAFLIPEAPTLDTTLANWVQKQVLDPERASIQTATLPLLDTGEHIRLHRDNKDADFSTDNTAEDETLNQSEVSRIINGLLSARFSEARPADDPDAAAAAANAHTITLTTFAGIEYTLQIGRRPEQRIEQPATGGTDAQTAEEPADAQTAEDEAEPPEVKTIPAGPVFISYASTDPGFIFADARDNAALKFPDYTYSRLPATRATLFEKPEPEEPADATDAANDAQPPAPDSTPATPLILAPLE